MTNREKCLMWLNNKAGVVLDQQLKLDCLMLANWHIWYVSFERIGTWWMLLQKRIVHTKFDIYVLLV
jgi:hypothetical protein